MKHRRPESVTGLICIAAANARLQCSTCCAACAHFVHDRRVDERRQSLRRSSDRRILHRM
jgi:hypothetical protein